MHLVLFNYFIQCSFSSTVKSCHFVVNKNGAIEKCDVEIVFLPECRLEQNSVVFCQIWTTIVVLKQVNKTQVLQGKPMILILP